MTLTALVLLAMGLTVTMFLTRQSMLGFPSVIFWAVLGAYAYTESTVPWGDWEFYLYFGAFGMVIFCCIAAWGLREKRDTLADKEMEKGEAGYIDEKEKEEEDTWGEGSDKPSNRAQRIREKAKKRRTG